jgi:hypothetical protein
MALRNVNMVSVLRGVLETNKENLRGVLETALAKATELGLDAAGGKAVTKVAVHEGRKNPLRGQPIGSSNFNGRSVLGWIESIPAVAFEDAAEEAVRQQAISDLQTLIATCKARLS